jgi:hypothetical protein
LQIISIISAISTGFFFALIRFFEPYLIFIIKKQVCEWFGILLVEGDDLKEAANDSLSAILVQSLNVELVNVILKAITFDHSATS